jgi:hypothetical protein
MPQTGQISAKCGDLEAGPLRPRGGFSGTAARAATSSAYRGHFLRLGRRNLTAGIVKRRRFRVGAVRHATIGLVRAPFFEALADGIAIFALNKDVSVSAKIVKLVDNFQTEASRDPGIGSGDFVDLTGVHSLGAAPIRRRPWRRRIDESEFTTPSRAYPADQIRTRYLTLASN